MYAKYVKRPFDFIVALSALVIGSPIIAIVAILVRVKLGSPIIFKQERPGLNNKIFTMYKFRTMTDEKDMDGNLLPDEIRLTKFGKLLRSTSLDELPELWNIVKGDMSLVGPRPQLVRDMVFFNEEQMKRHTVLPGLTGLAQISGRNAISWEEKLGIDLKYIKRITLFSDIKIIVKTIYKVLKKDDINTHEMTTAEDYGDYLLRIGEITIDTYSIQIEKSKMILNKYWGK